MTPAEELALAILKTLAAAVPPLAAWLSDVTSGRTDAFSLRVRDILPEQSASRAAADDMRAGR